MNPLADLHIHSHCSDGTDSPDVIVRRAFEASLQCIAITDHDTVAGVAAAQQAAKEFGLEVISGIELSTHIDGKDVHLLGYCFDPNHPKLLNTLTNIREARRDRVRAMVARLKDLGVGQHISADDVFEHAQTASVGRPHLAAVMYEKGIVGSAREAFDRYISEDGPAYVAYATMTPEQGVALIREAGGVAVFAHPMSTQKDEIIPGLVDAGLQGIEAYYPSHPVVTIDFYESLAKRYGLVVTGGSDYHGKNRPTTYIGRKTIAYSAVEDLKKLSRT